MAGFLIAEEGPLSGLIVRLDEGEEWVLGRDPDEATVLLEDPMVSRKHAILRKAGEGFVLENLSAVNPVTQNGKVVAEPVLLHEGDIVQIGSTFFRFTEMDPEKKEEVPPATVFEEGEDLSSLHYDVSSDARWLLKVIAGPNSGAEFGMQKGKSYIIGKDPSVCDIVFQDLSVSRQHARISVEENEHVFIEDLGSRNGTLVNGELLVEKRELSSQDVVALGTTTFLMIDREEARETIYSPPAALIPKEEPEVGVKEAKDWRETLIPYRYLIALGVFACVFLVIVVSMFSLFRAEPVLVHRINEPEQIQGALKNYPDVQFSFNTTSGKLFLVGHVLTAVEQQEMLYQIKGLPFVESIDDNVVVDEYVWQNMNALLATNPAWQGIVITAPKPGHFVMRGYLLTNEQAAALSDYINMNFPYLDRLDNQVVAEANLNIEIAGMLTEKGFGGVVYELSNGEVILSGRVDTKSSSKFNSTLEALKALKGVRVVKNYVVLTSMDTSMVDISSQYQISGYSKQDEKNYFVVINGKILGQGDALDGMKITSVQPNKILLEKDGIKFRINYNQQ